MTNFTLRVNWDHDLEKLARDDQRTHLRVTSNTPTYTPRHFFFVKF